MAANFTLQIPEHVMQACAADYPAWFCDGFNYGSITGGPRVQASLTNLSYGNQK